MNQDIHPILLELQRNSQQLYGFELHSWAPVSLGWLNLKWKLITDRGELLLKIYHAKRYRDVHVLTRALEQQKKSHDFGVPCPELITRDGEVLHSLEDEKFIIMQFYPGNRVKPKDINKLQMYELGLVTGKLHRILNDTSMGEGITPQFVPKSREERISHWHHVMEEAANNDMTHLQSRIELQLKLTETFDVDSLDTTLTGWTHRDLWVDNLLFYENKVSAVLDFDRLNFDYPELDVARAIMSWAFYNGDLRTDFVSAFLDGYRMEYVYPSGRLVNSLRMLWYMESEWWITAEMDDHNVVQSRFAEEMIWLSQNDERLPVTVGNL